MGTGKAAQVNVQVALQVQVNVQVALQVHEIALYSVISHASALLNGKIALSSSKIPSYGCSPCLPEPLSFEGNEGVS